MKDQYLENKRRKKTLKDEKVTLKDRQVSNPGINGN